MSALVRGVRILEELGRSSKGVSPSTLLARCDIPRATLFRLLKELSAVGLIAQDPFTGRYLLGTRMMALGHLARETSPLVVAARPLLREISLETGLMSELATAIGPWQLMMAEVWQVANVPLRVRSRAGLMFPMRHVNAPGLCYLAFENPQTLDEYLTLSRSDEGRRRLQLKRQPNVRLSADCIRIRRLGFALRQQSVSGVALRRLSVPVFIAHRDGRQLLGALGVVGAVEHIDQRNADHIAATLQTQSRRLERSLAEAK